VDRFKLRVGKAHLHNGWQAALCIQEPFQVRKGLDQLVGRRGRNVASCRVQPAGPSQFCVVRSSPGLS
jgi:hypothetical protein